jgi:hypothetical protein
MAMRGASVQWTTIIEQELFAGFCVVDAISA